MSARVGRAFNALGLALVLLCGLSICAQAVVLWRATRIEGYAFTRYYDETRARRERDDAGASVADLFAETGLEDKTGALETTPNRFMLGLLPGGGGRHAVSVLTLAGPGALASVVALLGLASTLRRSSPSAGRGADSARTP